MLKVKGGNKYDFQEREEIQVSMIFKRRGSKYGLKGRRGNKHDLQGGSNSSFPVRTLTGVIAREDWLSH